MRRPISDPFQRYLRLLGITDHPSGLDGLRTLVRRHLSTVPFENISKLLLYDRERAGRAATFGEFLDGIEFSDLGGTCYTNNPFFTYLLRELGYDAELLGADMSRPNVHTCIRVHIDSFAYHVDVGFAAAFREPMRLDHLPARVEEGSVRYVLDREGSDAFRMAESSEKETAVSYVVHGPPKPRAFFDPIVVDSYALASTFMNCLRISRVFDTFSLDLIDRKIYRHEAGKTAMTTCKSATELIAAVKDQFRMPRCPIEPAIAILEGLTGKPFFSAK